MAEIESRTSGGQDAGGQSVDRSRLQLLGALAAGAAAGGCTGNTLDGTEDFFNKTDPTRYGGENFNGGS